MSSPARRSGMVSLIPGSLFWCRAVPSRVGTARVCGMRLRAALFFCALLVVACSAGAQAVSVEDLEDRLASWTERGPDVYFVVYEGDVDGREVSEDAFVDRGLPDTGRADRFSVENLFAELEDRARRGETVAASFDNEFGYPTEVRAEGIHVRAKGFRGEVRASGCADAPGGGATDLRWEATERVFNTSLYDRWFDQAGCPVRTDVITTFAGPGHCGWEPIEFLAFAEPVGGSVDLASAKYFVRDVEDVLADYDNVDRSRTIGLEDLPATAIDTGYRRDGSAIWPAGETAYRVTGAIAEEFVLDDPRKLLCG